MAALVLVDTSAWILAVRRRDPRAKERLSEEVASGRAACCPLVLLELLAGRSRTEPSAAVRARLSALEWLPCTEAVWERAFDLATEARRRGQTVGAADALVAAHALEARARLLHADGDFARIAAWSHLSHESLIDR